MARTKKIIGIDIGNTKIACLLGEINQFGKIDILGRCKAPAQGFKDGAVTDLSRATETVAKCLEELKVSSSISDLSKTDIFVGIDGDYVEYLTGIGVTSVKNSRKGISKKDVNEVISQAQAIRLSDEFQILHIFPKQFKIDGQKGIKNPIGMFGVRLEVEASIVIGNRTIIENILKIFDSLRLPCNYLVVQAQAVSYIVTNEKERELGVAIIDIGGDTKISVFKDGVIAYRKIIPYGGNSITNDIAICLKLQTTIAEEIKIKYGVADLNYLDNNQPIVLNYSNNIPTSAINPRALAMIIEARLKEIFENAEDSLRAAGYIDNLPGGIVLTGGTTQLLGINDLANQIFGLPVRVAQLATEKNSLELDSTYLTALGIINFALQGDDLYIPDRKGILYSLVNKVKDLFF